VIPITQQVFRRFLLWHSIWKIDTYR